MDESTYNERLKHCIELVCDLVGIKNYPDGKAMGYLIDIFRKFESISPQEFYEAFKMNLAGEFNEVIKHFQSFDPTYMGAVLRKFKDQKAKKIHQKKQEQPVEEVSKKEMDRNYYNGLVRYYRDNNYNFPLGWNYSACFDHMESSGIANESAEWMQEFSANLKKEYLIELKAKKDATLNFYDKKLIQFKERDFENHLIRSYVKYKIKKNT